MKYWRSYNGMVTLAWISALAFGGALREVSVSDDVLMVRISYGVIVAAVAVMAFVVYLARKTRRRAENKVRMSNLILLTDIQRLAQSNSPLLDDAIALRCAQMEQGAAPATRP